LRKDCGVGINRFRREYIKAAGSMVILYNPLTSWRGSLLFTLYSLLFTLYSLLFTLYSLLFTLYSLLFTLYSPYSVLNLVQGFHPQKRNSEIPPYIHRCIKKVYFYFLTMKPCVQFERTRYGFRLNPSLPLQARLKGNG
jgi:hypothetical protein